MLFLSELHLFKGMAVFKQLFNVLSVLQSVQALVKVAAIKNIPFIFIDDSSVQLWSLRKKIM